MPLISPRGRAAVEAYTDGREPVRRGRTALPPEYAALEITRFEPWTVLDTMTVAKSIAFSLSFGLEDIDYTQALLTYQAVLGPHGRLRALLAGPLARAAVRPCVDGARRLGADRPRTADPADPARRGRSPPRRRTWPPTRPSCDLAREYLERVKADPVLRHHLDRGNRPGSNQWAVSGRHTDDRPAADRQRPAPRARHALDLLPDPSHGGRLRRDGQRLRRRPLRHRRAEPRHRVGLDRQPDGRHRRLRGAGGARPDVAERLQLALPGQPRVGDPHPGDVPLQPARERRGRRRRGGASRQRGRQHVHPARHAHRPATQPGPDREPEHGDRRRPQRAVHGLQRDARARHVPDLGHRPQPPRLPGRAAVLRQRHPEHRLRGRPRQHRLLHQLGDAAARGPAGADGGGRPALVHPQRPGGQRVAAGAAPAARAGDPVRDPARSPRCRTSSTRRRAGW